MTPSLRTQLSVLTIAAFQDNYLWLIHDGVHAAVVDPGDAGAVSSALASHNLKLTAILTTHHHADHIGGVVRLAAEWNVPVYGPANDGIEQVTVPVADGQQFAVAGLNLHLSVMAVPGHTLGHIAYYYDGPMGHWLFCGDALFGAGCGRMFEGTPEQMAGSLSRLASLPDDTLVYCAHEYTVSNLRFAQAVEPGNSAIGERLQQALATRAAGQPTIPSNIGLEKATNPFLRRTEDGILDSLRQAGRLAGPAGDAAVFAALRAWKDTFQA